MYLLLVSGLLTGNVYAYKNLTHVANDDFWIVTCNDGTKIQITKPGISGQTGRFSQYDAQRYAKLVCKRHDGIANLKKVSKTKISNAGVSSKFERQGSKATLANPGLNAVGPGSFRP